MDISTIAYVTHSGKKKNNNQQAKTILSCHDHKMLYMINRKQQKYLVLKHTHITVWTAMGCSHVTTQVIIIWKVNDFFLNKMFTYLKCSSHTPTNLCYYKKCNKMQLLNQFPSLFRCLLWSSIVHHQTPRPSSGDTILGA